MLNTINQLLSEVQTISESYNRVAAVTGENFNIFSILRMESDEVATHSRFIAELLDRNGSHGIKEEFLILFINRFCAKDKFNAGRSHVIIEYYIGKVEEDAGGRIDILIKDDEGNVILIENKIYAGEQHKQLVRYRNAFPKAKLFYLTLFGESSRDENSNIDYKMLSYETDVIGWLEECRKVSVNIPIVRESISQYIFLLKKLTNQNTDKRMTTDIINRVLSTSENLAAYKKLLNIQKDLKPELIKRILSKLVDNLESDGFSIIETFDFNKDRGTLISFQNKALKACNLSIVLSFEGVKYSNLVVGLYKSETNSTGRYIARNAYSKYRNWHFNELNDIYFDFDSFYNNLKGEVDLMLNHGGRECKHDA